MKTLVLFLAVVSVVVASQSSSSPGRAKRAFSVQPSTITGPTQGSTSSGSHPGSQPVTGGRGGGAFRGYEPINYGPKVYGQGALNRWALPPNPLSMSRALAFVERFPGALVRLDLDGELTIH
ncbi:hypothetical protein Pcinc_041082 [Petrolisthes cinctipes]|uniref:Uncharacterized protein n=1 Tax=Petrolisthes cinctipes TaxID=88211 RepID=A0AAE1EHD2_PETCI|nr:hypothetical protein Pcinc_041082 [Petrolisthes cinctipes]